MSRASAYVCAGCGCTFPHDDCAAALRYTNRFSDRPPRDRSKQPRKGDYTEHDRLRTRLQLSQSELDDLEESVDGYGPTEARHRLTEALRETAKRRRREYGVGRADVEEAKAPHFARAERFGVDASLTDAQWKTVFRAYNGCCVYCLSGDSLTMEHIHPMSRGGDHSAWNVAPACRSCNVRKRARTLDEWLAASPQLDGEAVRARIAKALLVTEAALDTRRSS